MKWTMLQYYRLRWYLFYIVSHMDNIAVREDSLYNELEKFVGTWRLETSENFEEYMKAVEVGFFVRKIGRVAKPQLTISVDKDQVIFRAQVPLITHTLKFKLGEEFIENTPDGRKTQTIFEMKDGKLIQTQRGEGVVPSTITREVKGDVLVCTFEAKEVISIRTFKKRD